MRWEWTLGCVLLAATLPLHGLLLPTRLGDFARAQERQRAAAQEARRTRLPTHLLDESDPYADWRPDAAGATLGWRYSVRYVLRATGAVDLAHDRPAEAITGAFETAAGWVFFTEWGRALASDSFLGPLREVAPVACAVPSRGILRGPAVQHVGAGFFTLDARRGRVPLSTPARTDSVRFCDPLRGAATTRDGALLRTVDGGLRWAPVALRTPTGQHDVALSLGCANGDADTGGMLVRSTMDWQHFDAAPAGGPLVALRPWVDPSAVEPDESPLLEALSRGRYEVLGAAVPHCAPPDLVERWEPAFAVFDERRERAVPSPMFPAPGVRPFEVPAAAGLARVLAPADAAHCHVELRWRGRDALGAFAAAADVGCPIANPTPGSIFDDALAVNRDGALFDESGDDPAWESALLWVSGDRWVALDPFRAPSFAPVATRLDDGRVLLFGVEERFVGGVNGVVLAVVHPDGSFTSYAWSVHESEAAILGPAEVGGRLGLAVVDGDHHARFLPMDSGEVVPLGALPDAIPAPCTDPVRDAVRLHLFASAFESQHYNLPIRLGYGPDSDSSEAFESVPHAVYELHAGALCLRTVDALQRPRHEGVGEAHPAVRFEAHAGQLVGTLDDGDALTRVHLSVAPHVPEGDIP